MKALPKPMQHVALGSMTARIWTSLYVGSLAACMCLSSAHADDSQTQARAEQTRASAQEPKAKASKAKRVKAPPPKAAEAAAPEVPKVTPAAPVQQPPVQEPAPLCKLGEAEQPRGGKLDVLGERFGSAPVIRIDGKPARILIRKQDRISVQIPADSDGGPITLQDEGKSGNCGTLVIIGKNR